MKALIVDGKKGIERIRPEYKALSLIKRRCRIFNDKLQENMEVFLEEIRLLLFDSDVSEDDIQIEKQGFFSAGGVESSQNFDPKTLAELRAIKKELEFQGAEVLRSFEIKIAKSPKSRIHILILDFEEYYETGINMQLKFHFYFKKIRMLRSSISNGIFIIIH